MKKFAIAAVTAIAAIASLSSVAEAHRIDGNDWHRYNGNWGHYHNDWGHRRFDAIVYHPYCGMTRIVRVDAWGNRVVEFVKSCG